MSYSYSYRGRGRGSQNYSGPRSYNNNSQHDDRWNNSSRNNNSSNRGYRGGGRGPRGGTRFKNFNSSRFRYQRPNTDQDGDVSMSGDSHSQPRRGRGNYSSSRSRGNSRYPRNNRHSLINSTARWYRVMIPFGSKIPQDELYSLIRANLENCDFKPHKYRAEPDSERAIFYVEKGPIVENLKNLSRRITKSDGHKIVFHVTMARDYEEASEDMVEKLKFRMSDRYNLATQTLNLKDLFNDEVLKAANIQLALNRISTMEAVTKIVAENIPELSGLDVSNNRLLSLSHMRDLVAATPGMKSLNLGNNQIRSMEELGKLKGWQDITELVLEGNDLRNHYSSVTQYISAVRKYFPKVLKLDGQVLPPPVKFESVSDLTLPPSKDCHFINDEIKTMVVNFVKEYYTLYDSSRRRDLMAAYHENAQFSLCVSKNPMNERHYVGFNLYLDESRNLKKIGHLETDKLVRKTKSGVLAIVSLLESLPATTHDLTSFKVDVDMASPTMLAFVLHGVFKEGETRGQQSQLRAFSRTIITVPSGAGMAIKNDMLTLANATPKQAKNAFQSSPPTPSSSPVSQQSATSPAGSAGPSSTYTQEQMDMVRRFCHDSGMNGTFSLQCLEENAWDYQRAGQLFGKLQSEGKIPMEAFVKTEGNML